jgi:hypothetical protein
MAAGLSGSGVDFPSPPITVGELNTLISNCLGAKNDFVAKKAEAKEATVTKSDRLTDLVDGMKQDLRYAENTVGEDDAKLGLIGWSGRKTPEALTPPEPPSNLHPTMEGPGTITLVWTKPVSGIGGAVKSYIVERRDQPQGGGTFSEWVQQSFSLEPEIILSSQPTGVQLEYRVISLNPAGTSEASNSTGAVL